MSDNCAESEYVPSWREYMKENSAWQSERTPNVYAAGFRAGMAYRPKVTYAPEDPTPEAIDVVSLVRRERVHPEAEAFQCRVTALALDAWGAALLRRPAGNVNDQMRISMLAEELEALKAELSVEQRNKAEIKAAHVAECERHAAARKELDDARLEGKSFWNGMQAAQRELESLRAEYTVREATFDARKLELESLRKPLEAPPCSCHGSPEGCAANCDPEFCGCARHRFIEAATAGKPLEGELLRKTWLAIGELDRKRVFYEYPVLFEAIEAALRAKGEPQAQAHQGCHCESCQTLGELSAEGLVELVGQQVTSEAIDTVKTRDAQRWQQAKGEPQAVGRTPFAALHYFGEFAATNFPDAKALAPKTEADEAFGLAFMEGYRACQADAKGRTRRMYSFEVKNLSLPEPAPPAPELPRKVEPGTTLTVGARYRITAISTDDSCPANQVGDVVIGFPKDSGMPVGAVFVNWDGAGYWFAKGDGPSGGTYVTGLELVDEPGEGE